MYFVDCTCDSVLQIRIFAILLQQMALMIL